MSELKAYSGNEIREDIDYNTRGIDPEDKEWNNYGKELCDTQYYLKSEADKVIAHHKYKRCLVMADMNWWQANRYSAAEMVERIRWHFEEAIKCSKFEEKYLKRYHKWLELAEKCKEAK